MILDSLLLVSGAYSAAGVLTPQLVTALGNTNSTNTIDVAAAPGNQVADMRNRGFTIAVLQSLTSGGAATVQIQLIQADDVALSVNVQVLNQTDAFPYASLPAKTFVPLSWPPIGAYVPKRYVGLRYVVGGAVLTNGTGQFMAAVAGEGAPAWGVVPIYRGAISVA